MARQQPRTGSVWGRALLASAAVGLSTVSATAQSADVSRPSNLTGLQTVDFQLERGEIVSSNEFAFIAEILGASITSGNTRVPVTAQLRAGDDKLAPWGNFFRPQQGNVNREGTREVYLHPTVLEEGDGISVAARSYLPRFDRRWNRWTHNLHISANTAFQSDFVRVLRDGDPAPVVSGFGGQQDAAEFVKDYLVDGRVRLHANQVIYLFELGTSNLNSAAADFQDLVMIVTLAESVEALEEVLSGPPLAFD